MFLSSYRWYNTFAIMASNFSFLCKQQKLTTLLSGLFRFYNYVHHGSIHSWHHTRELSVHNHIFAMFSEESFQLMTLEKHYLL